MSLLQSHERPPRTLHVLFPNLVVRPFRLVLTNTSKWFMLSLGPLELHKMLSGFDDKSAQAVCTFGYCEGPGHEPITFQGRTDGKLVPSRGPTVFGKRSCL
jgi:Ham1 family